MRVTALALLFTASAALAAPPLPILPSSPLKKHIKNVVVLVQENRSFDNFFGGLTYDSNIDSLANAEAKTNLKFCNPVNVTVPNSLLACAGPNVGSDVDSDDPNHGIAGINMQLFSTWHPDEAAVKSGAQKPNMNGFLYEQEVAHKTTNVTRAAEAFNYYTQSDIPVFTALAQNYVLFDRWFADVPGPTNPNRAYLTSGTSHGHGKNDAGFNWGGLPQRSIFQALSERGISWINYSNSTTSPTGYKAPNTTYPGFNPDAIFYNWTVSDPARLARVQPIKNFFDNAKKGTLPQFTWLNPECCSFDSFHPPSPIHVGEGFVKSVYEALRSSPQWEETLFVLTFDEHGGFADHVSPPVNVPAGDALTYTENAPDGKLITFDFTRLGVRVPTLLISPWVEKGKLEQTGPNKSGVYSHCSIIATISKLFDLTDTTPRTEWVSTFEHLISDKKRDTPKTLPAPATF
ncbi:hypothetical protein HDV00_009660 [Rhizophlyctis rosea]|nr:hypothetical protein HDV00_009660 [Rhizophlyctis rosea]